MKDLVEKAGLAAQFYVESAATSREEIGNPIYPPARRKLVEHRIACGGHAARQLTRNDYKEFNLLIGMDSANLRNMHRICGWITPTTPAMLPTRGTLEISRQHGRMCWQDVRDY